MSSSESYLDSLLAALNGEKPEIVEEPEIIEESEIVEVPEKIEITPISDEPNEAVSADEIAALFTQAEIDMETGDSLSEETANFAEPEIFEEEEEPEGISFDDILAQMRDEEEPVIEKKEDPLSDIQDEIEIDMNNPEELEMLLGLGERPDWSARKEEHGSEEQEAEETLPEPALFEENQDLEEINSLLNMLDNNEMIPVDTEESVHDFADKMDYEAEQEASLNELSVEEKGKKERKEKKLNFSFFGNKKKRGVKEENKAEAEVQTEEELHKDTELLSEAMEQPKEEQGADDISDLLEAFSQDNMDIPFDLFAEAEQDEGDLDLISMLEENERAGADKPEGKKPVEKDSEEKKGFFAKMLDVLTEEIPEEEQQEKETKKKKGKKGKKKPVTDADDNEGILEELDAEEDTGKKKKKAGKEKKPKKDKKKKQAKAPKEADVADIIQDTKKLPMKMVVRIFALCCSIMALILLINHFVPKFWSLADARNAFYKQDYETTYQEMKGKELSKADSRLYEKAKVILQLDRKVTAYENYKQMNLPVEALDSLLSGYLLWQQLEEKIAEYDAVSETDEIKLEIVNALFTDYQISEEEAAEINALDNYEYTLKLEEITGSLSSHNSAFYTEKNSEAVVVLEELPEQTADGEEETPEHVLPEEEIK